MTDQVFDDMVFAGVNSLHKRSMLITHNTLLLHRIKGLEEEISRLRAAAAPTLADTEANIRRDERQRTAAWIDQTNGNDTVRAKYARKVAETLRSFEA
jgi:hypothetical protein